jgi:hypothetical protein
MRKLLYAVTAAMFVTVLWSASVKAADVPECCKQQKPCCQNKMPCCPKPE